MKSEHPSRVDLAPLPSVDIERVEPRPADRRRAAGTGDIDRDLADPRVIRPNVPRPAVALGELGGEVIVPSDRTRPAMGERAAEISHQ